jgi:hypothetical protein
MQKKTRFKVGGGDTAQFRFVGLGANTVIFS